MRSYTGSTSNDDRAKKGPNAGKIMVNLKENIRDPAEIEKLNARSIARGEEPRYDLNEAWRNIYYEKCETYEEAFNYVFGESMEQYNASQKRNDRKTSFEKEMAKMESGKVKQELIHCMIVEVGNHDHHPPEEECVEILQEYLEKFREKFPNMRIVNCAIHLDEFKKGGPHLQIYYVPVKTRERHEELENPKKWNGMDVQPSMTGALEQMGYSNDAKVWVEKKDENGDVVLGEDGEPVMVQTHDYKNGAVAQWQKDYNGLLDEICLQHGIVIDHYMSGKKVEHNDTYDFYSGKINARVQQALHSAEQAEIKETEALFKLETTQEELQKAQTANEKLAKDNTDLEEKNKALQAKNDDLSKENRSLTRTLKNSYKEMEQDFLQLADEHFSYYRRAKIQIEKDPKVYEGFETARKLTKRTQNAWMKCRTCWTKSGRIRWAKKAQQLQARTNEAWGEAKAYAEYAREEAAMRRLKAEVKKEVNDLLKPHEKDFKTFCKTYESLSIEQKAKYEKQYELIRKKNKQDIKTMYSKLGKFSLSKNKGPMEYDVIKEIQEDRRAMNRMNNAMLRDKAKTDEDANALVADDDFEEMER